MKKCLKIFLCLLLSFVLAFGSTISVFASDLNDGENDGYDRFMGGTNIEGFNHWDTTSKKSFWLENFATFCAKIGLVIKTGNVDGLYESHINYLIENERIVDADSYDEFIASHLSANEEETELYMSNDLSNTLYNASVQYIEENTGYYVIPTLSAKDLLAENFYNKDTFDMFKNYINELGSDICFAYGYYGYGYNTNVKKKVNDEIIYAYERCYGLLRMGHDYGIITSGIAYSNSIPYLKGVGIYDEDWNYIRNTGDERLDCISIQSTVPYKNTSYEYNAENGDIFAEYASIQNYCNDVFFTESNREKRFFTADGRSIRVYKTLEDFKNYSVGTRPYYITDAFKNYDSTIDNSTTITQTEIDNSVTYGDVYNYITNNYDNPDGLSEDELRAILAEYLSQINNNNSGGGSGGSGDSGGSGGGLGGFLDGLGSVGNAILSILGKLMEILGSAIELVTGAITDLITIIPNSIGELLGALFPVFPEEWIKAITLSLVLGVVVGIVRMFK